jgi:hypothetical protein
MKARLDRCSPGGEGVAVHGDVGPEDGGARARRWLIAAIFLVIAGVTAGPAGAVPSYSLIARGDAHVRSGDLADGTEIQNPSALAVRQDGVIAFGTASTGEVFWVQGGILSRIPLPAAGSLQLDVAFAPDGALLIATCDEPENLEAPSAVWRAAPGQPPTLIAGRRGNPGTSGDGGAATAARLECPTGIDIQPDGGILIADYRANRIRRVGPDGIIRTVAGTGRAASDGDGGPAVQAGVQPIDVAALPDGGFAIADLGPKAARHGGTRTIDATVVRVVDAGGTITTWSTGRASSIAAEPSGSVLTVDAARQDGVVRRLAPDGHLSPITDLKRDQVGISPSLPVAGDPFGSDADGPNTVAASPDGGVLFGANFAVRYVPPPVPQLLAVGILPATRVPRQRLTVAVRTTRSARLYVGVWARGRRAAFTTTAVPGGDASVAIPVALRPGLYNVRVRAEGDGQIAAARADVLVGGLLPLAYARGFIRSRQELFRVFQDAPPSALDCRRMGRRRVDCGVVQLRHCSAVVTVRLRPDGTLAVAQYRGGRGRHCRFRR